MRVLVTGHDGYIGAVLVPMLREAGHEVVGLDTGLFARCAFGDDSALRETEAIRRDLREVETSDLEGFDAILHLGALSNDPLGNINSDLTYEINEKASIRLGKAAKEAGVERFVFSSSCSTYGKAGDDFLDETAEFNPVTPYAVSKVKVEAALGELADDSFTPVYLRNATAYGVSSRLRLDLVLNNLVGHAYTSGKILMLSDGTPWRPIVHIEDISRAFLAAMTAPKEAVHNEAFNIGRTAENYRIRELADIVAETVPNCEIAYAPDAGPDLRCYRVSCEKAEKSLPGYDPQWDARKGAQELYDAYRKWDMNADRFGSSEYKRLPFIKELIAAGELRPDLRWTDAQGGEAQS